MKKILEKVIVIEDRLQAIKTGLNLILIIKERDKIVWIVILVKMEIRLQ